MDRGKRGIKRSTAVDARGIPLGSVSAPANRHDSPLLVPTLERASESVGRLPERASVHLDRAYDSNVTRQLLEDRGLVGVISAEEGKPRLPCKPQTGGWWDAPTPGATPTRSFLVYREAGRGDRLLGGVLGRGHRRAGAHPGRLEPLPLGKPTSPPTVTYPRSLLHRHYRKSERGRRWKRMAKRPKGMADKAGGGRFYRGCKAVISGPNCRRDRGHIRGGHFLCRVRLQW